MDKVQKIKAEVERLKTELITWPDKSEIDLGRISAFEDILLYIDSLPEEPVSEGLEDFVKEYSFNIPSDVFHDLPEEKQALWKREIENAIVVGANWQLNKMMKDAVNGVAWEDFNDDENKYLVINATGTKLSKGDRFKLIIVKED